MSGSNVVGVVLAALICIYLVYALLRGERF
jgi:K+-transporting ATPase KdpF subunit